MRKIEINLERELPRQRHTDDSARHSGQGQPEDQSEVQHLRKVAMKGPAGCW